LAPLAGGADAAAEPPVPGTPPWTVGEGDGGTAKGSPRGGVEYRGVRGVRGARPALREVAPRLMVLPIQVPDAANGRLNLMSKCRV
jgi:hypothetical protein